MKVSANELIRTDCENVLKEKTSALSNLRGSTITVTGGTGFMGTWITELLTHLNDHHGFGVSVNLLARGIEHFKSSKPHLAKRKDVNLIKCDVRHLIELPKETNWLVHAAANPDNRVHASQPVETMNTIAEGTTAVLRAADRCSNLKMFLNISSGLIYGSQPFDLDKISESWSGTLPSGNVSSAYAEAKRYSETLCAAARSAARIPTLNIRPFAFIGPYQSLDSPWAINNFMRDCLAKNNIRVLGDGKTVRSYMYASDMAYWILSILCNGEAGQIWNLGSPVPVTLEHVATMVASHFKPSPEIILHASGNSMTRSRFVPSVSGPQETFGLTQTVDLETAVMRTIQWNTFNKAS